MKDVPQCSLCQVSDDTSGMKVNSNCDKAYNHPCIYCRDHIDIKERIQEAKRTLDNLILKRAEIRTKMNETHDPLIRRLPPEVISSIFRLCLPDYWVLGVPKHLNRAQARSGKEPPATGPLIFGAVCKQWRDVAWASPYLWNTIRIFLDRHRGPLHISTATEWLNRAGKLPLSIYISRSDWQMQEPSDPQLLSLLNERSARWKHIVFRQRCISDRMLEGSTEGAPMLRTIRVTCAISWTHGEQPIFSLLGPKPHPTHLSLDRCRTNEIDIDYSTLTHFFADEICFEDSVELFLKAPRLRHCKFGLMQEKGDVEPNLRYPTVHTNLRSLEIVGRPHGGVITMFLFLVMHSFPSLTHLNIKYYGHHNNPYNSSELAWRYLETHITRSSPPLISFKFETDLRLVTSRLSSILHATPLLTELEVSWRLGQGRQNEDGDDLFNLFTDPNTSPTFLPNLRSLGIFLPSDKKEVTWFWGRVLGIFEHTTSSSEVKIHCQNVHRCPLRTLRVHWSTLTELYESEETVRRLHALQQAGINIDIGNGPYYTKRFIDEFQKALDKYGIERGAKVER